jgi:peroxiredoxin
VPRTLSALAFVALLFGLLPASHAAGPGEPAPTFALPTLEGVQFDLASQIGRKVIVLDWWSINCTTCVQEIPKLIDISTRYPAEVQVIGINVDSFILKRVQRFLQTQSFRITYPIVIDAGLQVMKKYGSSILPTTVVIDKKGKIVFSHVGYKAGDEAAIEEAIRKAIAAK